jgi:hypothetical protein
MELALQPDVSPAPAMGPAARSRVVDHGTCARSLTVASSTLVELAHLTCLRRADIGPKPSEQCGDSAHALSLDTTERPDIWRLQRQVELANCRRPGSGFIGGG